MARERLTSVDMKISKLSSEENDRLTRVGAGTPMGEVMRRYWMPACLSAEVPDRDGPPVRVRLLGEDLVVFRDSNGSLGVVEAYCAHRRAPLFLGRNEECGLRCVYHGWKFDTSGQCVDLPSEPEFSRMKEHVRIRAYPAYEAGGLVWAFLGAPELRPPVPAYEWLRIPSSHFKITKVEQACNFMQGVEGGIDTVHSSFLHNEDIANRDNLRQRDTRPSLEVDITDYGFTYVGIRNISEDESYLRVYQFIMPFQKLQGNFYEFSGKPRPVPVEYGHLWVPMDDDHTAVYNVRYSRYDTPECELTDAVQLKFESDTGRGPEDYIPGTFRLVRNPGNDWLIDREVQRTRTFTGIKGVNTQDVAIQEGMGPIVDRSREYLGTTDRAIAAARQLLLEATYDVAEGVVPRGVDPEPSREVRGADLRAPRGVPWRDYMKEALVAVW